MELKIIGAVFGYLLCGVGVLELMRLYDRHTDFMHQWLDYDYDIDEFEQVMVVLLFPVVLACHIIPWLIGKLVFAFIKAVQMIFTTLAYTIVALIKGRDDGNDN